ncbi:hypothetical protein D9M71_704500 [compost metagenome]
MTGSTTLNAVSPNCSRTIDSINRDCVGSLTSGGVPKIKSIFPSAPNARQIPSVKLTIFVLMIFTVFGVNALIIPVNFAVSGIIL